MDQITDLASALGDIVADPSLDASEKVIRLKRERDELRARIGDNPPMSDLESVLGLCDRYIADLELQREGRSIAQTLKLVALGEDGDVRDEMRAAGWTEAQLDDAGLVSHESLSEAREDGVLEEMAFGAALNPELLKQIAAKRHRGRGGEFANEMHGPPKLKDRTGKAIPVPKPGFTGIPKPPMLKPLEPGESLPGPTMPKPDFEKPLLKELGKAVEGTPKPPEAIDVPHLPDNLDRYFTKTDTHQDVPLEKVKTTRARAKGIKNAAQFMHGAYHGTHPPRKPVSLQKEADGSYTVLDGNSTTAIARVAGWSHIRGEVTDVPPKESPGVLGMGDVPKERMDQVDAGMREMIQPGEDAKPQQSFGNADALFAAAEADFGPFKDVLASAAKALGGEVAAGGDAALASAKEHPDKPQVLIGPLKKMERAKQKVDVKYGGNWDKLQDVVRATVLVGSLEQMPQAMDAMRAEAAKQGWTIQKAENRYLDPPPPHNVGPTGAGYRDAAIALVSPSGLVTEVQLNTASMFEAKQSTGHKLYEQWRQIEATVKQRGDDPTPEEAQQLADLERQQKELYQAAWERSYGSA